VNRWIVLQVDDTELFDYLLNEKTLKDLFENKLNSLIFLLDIDSKAKYKAIYLLPHKSINEAYVPENESYYNQEVPKYYQNLINEPTGYFSLLLKNAFYLKIKPHNDKLNGYEGTVSSEDVAHFLHNLTDSVINFTLIKVKKIIYNTQSSNVKFTEKIRELFTPRIVDLKRSSFCVGLAIDPIDREPLSTMDSKKREELIFEYKNDVIDIELENEGELKRIIEKYSPEERHKIYDPFIKATENKNYYVVKINRHYDELKKYKELSEKSTNILLPDETKLKIELPTTERIAKVKCKEGQKVHAKDVTLFDPQINASCIFDEIKCGDIIYKLRQNLICKYDELNGVVCIENYMLGIFAQGKNADEAKEMFSEEFDFIYNRYNELPDEKLTDDVKFIKQFLNNIVIR